MPDSIRPFVVDTIVRWAQRLVAPQSPPRMNYRLVFGSREVATAVAAALPSSRTAWYVVRSSSDLDAVKLRHGRPAEPPNGVEPDTPLVYLLFWQPGDRGHDRNAQSLTDLRAVDVTQILSDPDSFVLPREEVIDHQCAQAAAAWKDPERARAYLSTAWRAVRTCLRERKGGRQRSIPFVGSLDVYGRYLAAARVPDEEWAAVPPAQRTVRLVQQWGIALPELSMFRMPALASVLGFQVDSQQTAPRKPSLETWVDKLDRILSENIDTAMDFSSLAERIAGVRTIEQRLAELRGQIDLSSTATREEAGRALVRFCHDGDPEAMRIVDWLFLKDAPGKRAASLGLKGLLIARGAREPRERPEDRVARETTEVLLSLLGIAPGEVGAEAVEQYVEGWKQALARDAREAAGIATHLRSLAAGQPPTNVAHLDARAALDRIARLPDPRAGTLEHLARKWERFGEETGQDDQVSAPTLLLGMVRLCAKRLGTEGVQGRHILDPLPEPGEVLVLSLVDREDGGHPIEVPAAPWDAGVRDALHTWMLGEVRRALFTVEPAEEADEEGDEDAGAPIRIAIERRGPSGRGVAMGTVNLPLPRARRLLEATRSDALMSWRLETQEDLPGTRLLAALFGPDQYPHGEGRCPREVIDAREAYVRSLGREPGWSTVAALAPLGASARAWVETWAGAIGRISLGAGAAEAAGRRQDLERQRDFAIREQRWPDVQRIASELEALPDASAAGTLPPLEDVRSLLRACAGSVHERGVPTRLVLTPHHPLTLRLQAISDLVLSDVLRTLWNDGWPASAVDDLEDTVATWGLPEPIHAYGFWHGEPLVFDGWSNDNSGFAVFAKLGARRGLESASLGVKEVARVVARYAELFPAAADRLGVRMCADREGEWAWRILDALLTANHRIACDVDIATDLPDREPTAIERAVQGDDERRRVFELGPEGVIPQVRFRRGRHASDDGPLHLALVVGDGIDAFRPTLRPERGEPGNSTDLWSPRVLFEETRPALFEAHIAVGDRRDGLSRNVARAVGFAMGEDGLVFRERYVFDREQCEAPLSELQSNAHWLVLASRQPLYRAVQQAPGVASLLDFYSATERGRPVHVCVSLNAGSTENDLRRLDAVLRSLLGPDVAGWCAEKVIAAATRFAPGLAMRCAGAVTTIDVEGLVGLLLTGAEVRAGYPGSIALSLDQHRRLLARSGQLGDVLAVRDHGDHVSIAVAESKFTSTAVDATSAVVGDARAQVGSTVSRLQHLSASHPLSLRVRSVLARALVHQIHLAPDRERAAELSRLVETAAAPDTPILIEPETAGAIHVWSTSPSTADAVVAGDGTPVHIHGHTTTMAKLRSLSP